MTKPLRLGVAGLGVVGTGLIRLLQRQRAGLVARAGRECALAAYSARREDDRGVDLGEALYFEERSEACRLGRNRRFRRIDRRRRWSRV